MIPTMATNIDDIITNLRAIIISSKGGLKLSDVRADYKEAFGVDIPLKALGFSSLEEFLTKNSQNFTIHGNTVQAVTKSSSVHIVSLINRQNSRNRGRSKLSSKQARNLRKPIRTSHEVSQISFGRKPPTHNLIPRFSRQNSNKPNVSSALKQMHEMQRMTANRKTLQTTQNIQSSRAPDKPPEMCNTMSQSGGTYFESLKGIKRTVLNTPVPNPQVSTAKSENKSSESRAEKTEPKEVPFEDFEDLHISARPQSRLLKIKSNVEHKLTISGNQPSEGPKETVGSPPVSPFRISLAINTEQEILSAKRTAHSRLDNNNTYPSRSKENPAELMFNLEGDSKFVQKLNQFCVDKGLTTPSYSTVRSKSKGFSCQLSIGNNFQVSTYPVETHSEVTARELAAKKTYNLLSSSKNLPSAFDSEDVVKLKNLCSQRNLPEPVFKFIECRPKNEPGYHICKVKIGENISLSSYPEELQNELSAKDVAARKAIDHLSASSTTSVGVSKNDGTTLIQIYNLIKAREYGVWSSKLPILYLETYKEELQCDWFDLVKNSSRFDITHIERAGHIIRAKSDTQLDEITEEHITLASLKVPESNQWEVYITNVVSSAEIWCRLIGKDYSELYDTMMTTLELQPPTVNVKNPTAGEIYLVNLEESWNRVKVTEIFPEKNEASVFLIDIGLDEVVKLSQLFYLQKTFFSLPPQAILLSLNELDCLAECEELQPALFNTLLGNSFIAEIVAILDDGGNVSSVILWDTSTDDDVNVNLKLIDDVIKTVKGPTLPSLGLVSEMYVSWVDDNGDVFLQSSQKNAQNIDCIISIKLKNSGSLVNVSNNKIDPKKLYITRSNKRGSFCRAKLSKALDANSAIVRFIDYGYEQRVEIDDLFDLEQTSIDLATIPSQVVCVKFANLKIINSRVLSKIREYIVEQNVLVKVTQMNLITLPSVELFKRSQTDGTLSSVNNKVINDNEFSVAEAPSRKKSYVLGLESTLSKDLPMPTIPPIGSYFNVIVTLAAHPGLFSVQPLTTQNQLMELMFRLQEKCESSSSKTLSNGEFKIGELYAVKHADDYWYRGFGHAFASPSTFTICLCDFGDFIVVPCEKLMPLSSEFKTFPYQAIRSYLAGITPVDADWTPEDCFQFRKMVVEKQLVSQVVEINRDVNNPNYITLGLILVDTTTAEDVYIHQLLIEKNIAVLKTK